MASGTSIAADHLRRLAAVARVALTSPAPEVVAQRAAALALMIRLANAGLAYVAQVVLARIMGQFEYGVFAYTWVWLMVFGSIATAGFGDSPLRFISQLRERGEEDHLRGFIRLGGWAIGLCSGLAAAVVIAAMQFADGWIDSIYVLPMILMGVSIPFICAQSYLEAVGRCFGWTIPALVPVYILRHALLLVFMAGAVFLGFKADAITALICLVATLAVSLLYQGATILLRLRRALPTGARAYRAREWVRGSLPFSLLHAAAYLSSFADVLVLSFFVGPVEIAIYFAATRIIQVVNLVPFAATVGSAHLFAASHTRGDHYGLQRLCTQVAVVTFVISTIAVAAIIVAGEPLLRAFGQGFEPGYMPLCIMAAGVVVRVMAGPAEDILTMTGHSSVTAWTYVAVVPISMALAAALIVPFGTSGAAIATSAGLVLRAAWLAGAARTRLGIDCTVFAALPLLGALVVHRGRRRELPQPAE